MARRCLDAGDLPDQGGEKPRLTLVTGESACHIACDAAITPVIVDHQGQVLYVGRSSRSVSPRLHKALNLRDRHCQTQGCMMPPARCTPHHIIHWADGGPTELSNLKLHCSYHHRMLHPENARYREGAGIQRSAP